MWLVKAGLAWHFKRYEVEQIPEIAPHTQHRSDRQGHSVRSSYGTTPHRHDPRLRKPAQMIAFADRINRTCISRSRRCGRPDEFGSSRTSSARKGATLSAQSNVPRDLLDRRQQATESRPCACGQGRRSWRRRAQALILNRTIDRPRQTLFASRPAVNSAQGGSLMRQKSAVKWIAGAAVMLTAAISLPAHAGKTLDTMKQRGPSCAASTSASPGFSAADSQGNWTGLDVDCLPRYRRCRAGRPEQGEMGAAERAAALHRAAIGRDRHPVAQHHLDTDPGRIARPGFCRRHLLRRPGLHGAEEDEDHERQELKGLDGLRAVRHHHREEPDRLLQAQ